MKIRTEETWSSFKAPIKASHAGAMPLTAAHAGIRQVALPRGNCSKTRGQVQVPSIIILALSRIRDLPRQFACCCRCQGPKQQVDIQMRHLGPQPVGFSCIARLKTGFHRSVIGGSIVIRPALTFFNRYNADDHRKRQIILATNG